MYGITRIGVVTSSQVIARRTLAFLLCWFLTLGLILAPEGKADSASSALATGWGYSLFIQSDKSLWAWGVNGYGTLGDGTTTDRHNPVHVMSDVTAVGAGNLHSLAVRNDGSLWSWGNNERGQLGDGTTTERHSPVQVMDGVMAVAGGYFFSLALKSDGTLWASGNNDSGQVGDGTTTERHAFVQVMRGVTAVAAGGFSSLALKNDATLWGWGDNQSGQLGDGTTTDRHVPVQVMSGVSAMATGCAHSLALQDDGSLWAWGENYFGQLGDGTTIQRHTPVQVMSNVSAMVAGCMFSLALKNDGTLWAWGDNALGQVGDGTTTDRYEPVQVMSDVTTMAAGGKYSLALGNDGTLWSWGDNASGQLGDGTTTEQHSPVQVQWLAVSSSPVLVSVTGSGQVSSADGALACPELCTLNYPLDTRVTLSATPDDGWEFSGWGGACTGTADCTLVMDAPRSVTANFTQTANRYQLDSPVNASFESGIGIVYGWVCSADSVSFQVDESTVATTAYGAERSDSQEVCGDTANGFAATINWSNYGDGSHRFKLIADGEILTEVAVTVTTLGERFIRGLSGATQVEGFPSAGTTTWLEWSEPNQNFVVAARDQSAQIAYATTGGNWEGPVAGGTESGLGLIRGWACDAQSVVATLDGSAIHIPYGSDRADTQSSCGDAANGYAVAIDWNALGDGMHQIDLSLDGTLLGTRTFNVASPGGQGLVSGVQKQQSVSDFPAPGSQVTLQWSEPDQNFRLIGYALNHRDAAWQVAEIYIATLGYAPDAEGLSYWTDNLDSGTWTPGQVAQSFFDQPLVQAQYPADQGFGPLIDALYQNLFGRTPDEAGYAYWLGELESGRVQRNQMIIALIEGGWDNPEAASDMARFGNRVGVALAFAAAQSERGILYGNLSEASQARLREFGTSLLENVTEDLDTRTAAIATIPELLDSL